jgi:hypothetical protein
MKIKKIKAVDRVPSRIIMLEGNMDWLKNTPYLAKRRDFLLKLRQSWRVLCGFR